MKIRKAKKYWKKSNDLLDMAENVVNTKPFNKKNFYELEHLSDVAGRKSSSYVRYKRRKNLWS